MGSQHLYWSGVREGGVGIWTFISARREWASTPTLRCQWRPAGEPGPPRPSGNEAPLLFKLRWCQRKPIGWFCSNKATLDHWVCRCYAGTVMSYPSSLAIHRTYIEHTTVALLPPLPKKKWHQLKGHTCVLACTFIVRVKFSGYPLINLNLLMFSPAFKLVPFHLFPCLLFCSAFWFSILHGLLQMANLYSQRGKLEGISLEAPSLLKS